tara:strand:+ start:2529 stop:3791 length:1263 start_codon:yes stop_codon:yes gene_type:complete
MSSDHKRRRLTTLDDVSSSDDDWSAEEESSNYFISMLHPELDQVPILLIAGKWIICFDEMAKDLEAAVDSTFSERAMCIIRAISILPLDAAFMHRAFLKHNELGIAYLALFPLRDKYYTMFKGKRWSRGSRSCVMPEFAHADASVAPSNSSGILGVPMQYALKASTFFLDLGMGEGSYLVNMPDSLHAGGYEINTNPLLMDQILHNILHYHAAFHFIPMDFSRVALPNDAAYTLFSWHPGTHEIPNISGCKVTAFVKGAKFENVASQGLKFYSGRKSVVFYSNHEDAAMVQWQSGDEERDCTDETPPDDFIAIMSKFDLVAELQGDSRKIRTHMASLEEELGEPFPRWKTTQEASEILSSVDAVRYARWALASVKWSIVKAHLLRCCCNMTTRMLLSCGVPQSECRKRVLTMSSVLPRCT